MVRIEDASQSLSTHVSVYLRSCKVGVAQEFLHSPQIGPAIEQMGRIRVAQGMGVGGDGRPVVEDAADIA